MTSTASSTSPTGAWKCGYSVTRLMDGHPRHAEDNLLYTTNRRGGAHHQTHNKKGARGKKNNTLMLLGTSSIGVSLPSVRVLSPVLKA